MKFSYILLGIMIGMFLNNLSIDLGEQRYSDAIKKCVREIGPNK